MILIILLSTLPSCSMGERILEARDVRFDKIIESNSPTTHELKLSGQAFHSALVISNIKVIQEKDILVILVYMSLNKGKSGYLDYTVSIPDSVNEVMFGNDRALIWKRGIGVIPQNGK